ncbi:hypothetical protein CK203_049582 [Vitis vinifera]|uniref:Uncharacterized protein n=1 Tax=Vitis vinifera TaxID=29760 RepID=A0A438F2E7_VITVI|nr:hypothetical protein CK203_090548 [Vitis vinifera]RVW65262.1 hypothetical protein CK203_049582 [Vitis vinifera]
METLNWILRKANEGSFILRFKVGGRGGEAISSLKVNMEKSENIPVGVGGCKCGGSSLNVALQGR